MYWRIRKTPKAETTNGAITACRWSIQPKCLISMYRGITPSWTGTIIVAMTTSSSALRPRKSSFANANPASALKKTTQMVTTPATIAEFASAVQKSTLTMPASKRRRMLLHRWPPGVSTGGYAPSAELSCDATTNDQ